MPTISGLYAYSPPEIARKIAEIGVRKAGLALLPMAWADRFISTRQLVRNWVMVYVTNLVG